MTFRGLEEDREFTLDNGVFVIKVLEIPRIGSVWQGLKELQLENLLCPEVGGTGWGTILMVMGSLIEEEPKPHRISPQPSYKCLP